MYRELYSALRIAQIRHEELLREAEQERLSQALRWQWQGQRNHRRRPSLLRRLFGLDSQARRRPVL
ncbi:hypothetical protein [Limnochorda pilosa]|nr:hypothetical protein [Limnochorda pilosa]